MAPRDLKDRPENYTVFDASEEEATRKAFGLRPELAIARGREEQQEVLLKFARNERLPRTRARISGPP